jgi:hypothetical protein
VVKLSNQGSKNKTKATISIDDVRDFFEQNPELKLSDLDAYTLLKLIIYNLDQTLSDANGNPPAFTINNNFVFIEIEDLRFTLELRDTKKYN